MDSPGRAPTTEKERTNGEGVGPKKKDKLDKSAKLFASRKKILLTFTLGKRTTTTKT